MTAFALDGYGRYNLIPTLNSIKKSIETLPIGFYEDSYKSYVESEESETDDFEFFVVPNGL